MRDVVITHAVRTPIGRIGGSLRNIPDKELGRLVVEDLLKRSGLSGNEIDHVILGRDLCITPIFPLCHSSMTSLWTFPTRRPRRIFRGSDP